MSESQTLNRTVVVGDGWAALGAVALLNRRPSQTRHAITWVTGETVHLTSALSCLEKGPGVLAWREVAQKYGVNPGSVLEGDFVRMYSNRSFRSTPWAKEFELEERQKLRENAFWEGESLQSPLFAMRSELSPSEIDERVRSHLEDEIEAGTLRRIERVPVVKLEKTQDGVHRVTLGSGDVLECERLIFADHWAGLLQIEGASQEGVILKGENQKQEVINLRTLGPRWKPVSCLQVRFSHSQPVAQGVRESFQIQMPKAVAKTTNKKGTRETDPQRHIWGHFFDQGRKSVWNLYLTSDEIEDNHEVMKRLRKVRQALNRAFSEPGWLPDDKNHFTDTVSNETFRFVQDGIFTVGNLNHPVFLGGDESIILLNDGFGPGSALEQVYRALAADLEQEPSQWEAELDAIPRMNQTDEVEALPIPDILDPPAVEI